MIGKVERAQDMNTNGFLTLRSLKMIRHHFVKLNAIIIIYMLPTRVLSWGMFYGWNRSLHDNHISEAEILINSEWIHPIHPIISQTPQSNLYSVYFQFLMREVWNILLEIEQRWEDCLAWWWCAGTRGLTSHSNCHLAGGHGVMAKTWHSVLISWGIWMFWDHRAILSLFFHDDGCIWIAARLTPGPRATHSPLNHWNGYNIQN